LYVREGRALRPKVAAAVSRQIILAAIEKWRACIKPNPAQGFWVLSAGLWFGPVICFFWKFGREDKLGCGRQADPWILYTVTRT